MKLIKLLAATALAAPAMLAFTAPAQAQVAGIATVNPVVSIGNSKAWAGINQQIQAMFKANLDQAANKDRQMQPLLAQLDKNNDKVVDDDEKAAAAAAKSPALTQAGQLEREIATLEEPASRAQAYGVEQLLKTYNTTLRKVISDKKINIVLTPASVIYAPNAIDITEAVTAELDKSPVAQLTVPPTNWNPSRDVVGVQQQLGQYGQILRALAAQQQAQQRAAAPQGTAPAPAAPKPQQPAQPR